MTLNLYSAGKYSGVLSNIIIGHRTTDYHTIQAEINLAHPVTCGPLLEPLSIGINPQLANAFVPEILEKSDSLVRLRGIVYHTAPPACSWCEGGHLYEAGTHCEGWVTCEKCNGTGVAKEERK